MSAQHAMLIKVQHPHAGERGWELAFEPGLDQVCQDMTEEHAIRMAACWNACVGLDPDLLARFGLGTATGSEIFKLRGQRAELLAALDGLLNILPSATTHPAIKAAKAARANATKETP